MTQSCEAQVLAKKQGCGFRFVQYGSYVSRTTEVENKDEM